MNMKILETDRLILRKFKIDDYKEMFDNWASDEKVCKYVSFTPHKDYKETKEILNKWIKEYDMGNYNFAVELKDTKEIIGNIETVSISKKNNTCELGYCYGSKYWGCGYATEALRRVIEFLLIECDFHLVETKHKSSNPASGRVMEKAGMKKDGILRERRYNKETNMYDDLIVYSMTKEDLWEGSYGYKNRDT